MRLSLSSPRFVSGRVSTLRRLRILAGAAAALLAVGSTGALAQTLSRNERPGNPVRPDEGMLLGPVMFSPSVFMSLGYETNVQHIQDGQVFRRDDPATPENEEIVLRPTSDTLTIVRPRLGFKLPFSHSYASLVYSPQYRDYASTQSPLHTSHQVSFETRLNFVNGSSIQVKDDFIRSFVDLRGPAESETRQFSSTPYLRNHPEIDLDWSFASGWGVSGSLERTSFVFDRTEVIDFVSQVSGQREGQQGLFDFFDYVDDSVEVRGYKNLGRYKIFTSMSLGRTNQDRRKFNESRSKSLNCPDPNGDGTVDQSDGKICNPPDFERIAQRDASVGMKGQLLRKTDGELELSFTSWDFSESGSAGFSGLSASAKVSHYFDQRTTGFLHLERAPLPASGVVTGYYVLDRFDLNIERRLSRSLTAKVGFDYLRTSFPSSFGSQAFSVTEYLGDMELMYRPAQSTTRPSRLVMILSYRPELQRSDRREEGLDEQNHRLGLSLQYGWF